MDLRTDAAAAGDHFFRLGLNEELRAVAGDIPDAAEPDGAVRAWLCLNLDFRTWATTVAAGRGPGS